MKSQNSIRVARMVNHIVTKSGPRDGYYRTMTGLTQSSALPLYAPHQPPQKIHLNALNTKENEMSNGFENTLQDITNITEALVDKACALTTASNLIRQLKPCFDDGIDTALPLALISLTNALMDYHGPIDKPPANRSPDLSEDDDLV